MWGRKKRELEQSEQVATARAAQTHAEEVIARVDAQEEEVKQIVTRLATRERANNFGNALTIAMERRK